ncbi:MAG: hypothetical protein CVT84_01865 [Alphaproteobacteria bacterium HGW-Alphaproteobacteria-6]|nr:MAG: hypothetical protein CVT84_01865 [Alphaproteobacteria bacterium HGW-Alphaproteobacteria-6]
MKSWTGSAADGTLVCSISIMASLRKLRPPPLRSEGRARASPHCSDGGRARQHGGRSARAPGRGDPPARSAALTPRRISEA